METPIVTNNTEDFKIFDLWAKYRRFWPWLALSIAVCCSIAVLYVKVTPKSYSRMASVMIKDDSEGTPDITSAFSDRMVLTVNSNVKNEVEAFKSPHLIQEAIRRLNLTVKYSLKKGLKTVNLYPKSPVMTSFPDSNEADNFAFYVEFTPDGSVTLSEFRRDDLQLDAQPVNGKFHDTIQTPVGRIVVSPTQYHETQWCFTPLEVYKNSIDSETNNFAGRLNIGLNSKDNSIVNLEITDKIIARAEDFLNSLMTVYNENWILEKSKISESAVQFINDRLVLVERELKTIDDELERYKRHNLITNVQAAASTYASQSSEYSARILDINNQIAIANFIKDYLNQDKSTTRVLPANSGLTDPAIEQQIAAYNALLISRDGLLANSSDKNPLVIDRNNQLLMMQNSIIQGVDNRIATLNLQLSGFQAEESRMAKNIASNPGQERHLLSIEREHKTKESLYLYLLQKKEEHEMALLTSSANTRIISPPAGLDVPVAPKGKLILMIAFAIGVGIPCSVIWGKETLNTKIRGENDLNGLSVPLLGTISLADKLERKNGELLVRDKGQDALNEAFRIIRTHLDSICDRDKKVIMFTSLESGSGKTFTALNLAMTLSLAGKRIALLDMDMRTATLSRMISLPVQGISYFLNGTVSEERYITEKDYFYVGFDVIPVGEIPNNPTELLLSDRLNVLIERLKSNYDYVFLDSTPLDMVADATIIGKFADLTIFLVREGHTSRRKVPVLEKIYKKRQFKNMVMILNGVKLNIPYNKPHTYNERKSKNIVMLPRATYPDRSKLLPLGSKAVQ